jgi:hypothetical protein
MIIGVFFVTLGFYIITSSIKVDNMQALSRCNNEGVSR